jgi:hypothetical protein
MPYAHSLHVSVQIKSKLSINVWLSGDLLNSASENEDITTFETNLKRRIEQLFKLSAPRRKEHKGNEHAFITNIMISSRGGRISAGTNNQDGMQGASGIPEYLTGMDYDGALDYLKQMSLSLDKVVGDDAVAILRHYR